MKKSFHRSRRALAAVAATLLTAGVLALPAPSAANQIIYQTGFEPPEFNAALPLQGQDGFQNFVFPAGPPTMVSTENPQAGAQCLRWQGAVSSNPPAFFSTTSFRPIRELVDTNRFPLRVEIRVDVRLDGPQTGTLGTRAQDMLGAELQGVDLLERGLREITASLRISSAGMVFSGFPNFFSTPVTLGEYHTLGLRLDYFARKVTYLVDGVELGTEPIEVRAGFEVRASFSDQFNDGPLVVSGKGQPVNTPELTYDPANYAVSFDNYRIESIPLSPSDVAFQFPVKSLTSGPFIPDKAIDEAAGVAKLSVLRRGYIDSAVSAAVSIPGGTALPGMDYQPIAFVNFAAGQKTGFLEIPIVQDRTAEADKYLDVVLSSPVPAGVWRGYSSNRLWVLDNDRAGSLSEGFNVAKTNLGMQYVYFVACLATLRDDDDVAKFYASIFGGDASFNPVSVVARFNGDGSLDSRFQPYPLPDFSGAGPTQLTPLDDDDRVLVNLGNRLVRLGSTGIPDPDCKIVVGADGDAIPFINEVLVERDARKRERKIIIAGSFTSVNGVARKNVARLRANGAIDPTFDPGTGPDDVVLHAALAPEGKLLLAGPFKNVQGQSRSLLARLSRDGSLDAGFDPGASFTDPFGGVPWLSSLVAQPDGKILVGGLFDTYQGEPHNALVRLLPNGAPDASFDLGTGFSIDPANPPWVEGVKLQRDGKLVVTGAFSYLNDTPATGIVRLDRRGALDPTFRLRGTDPMLTPNYFHSTYYGVHGQAAIALLPGGDILCALDSLGNYVYLDNVNYEFGSPLNYTGDIVRLRGSPARCEREDDQDRSKSSRTSKTVRTQD